MPFLKFSDNLLHDSCILLKNKSVDNFEIVHKTYTQFWFGVQISLKEGPSTFSCLRGYCTPYPNISIFVLDQHLFEKKKNACIIVQRTQK